MPQKERITLRIFTLSSSRVLGEVAVVLSLLVAPTLAFGQAKKPLTSDDLIQMKKAGFDEQTMIRAIEANGVSIDTSLQGLLALKNSGLGGAVINSALSAAAPKSPPVSAAIEPNGLPDEVGLYLARAGTLVAVQPEVVNFKTGGMLKAVATYGIAKAKFNGTVRGEKSSIQVTSPIEVVLRCQDGTAPSEYQLVMLEAKKDHREFTAGRAGLTGASMGLDKSAIALKFDKIGKNTYKTQISVLKRGEYGFLAPGAVSTSNMASSGKMYTFRVTE
ncbi:MAG: hypothetical protein HY233_05740 [Acidobacteriales bacterium]|nr:hypothetical protein [Terriglobales bacterium]